MVERIWAVDNARAGVVGKGKLTRVRTILTEQLTDLLAEQDGVITVRQAAAAGLSRMQCTTLVQKRGWTRPVRGILAVPDPADPFRTSVRAALLACPLAAAAGITAARIHRLWVPRQWTPDEVPELLIAGGVTHRQRRGMHLRSGLYTEQQTVVAGFAVTTVERTVYDLAVRLRLDDLVPLVDSALAKGCRIPSKDSRRRSSMKVASGLADARSESPLESRLRLILTRAGLAPEELQFRVADSSGRIVARLDMAWPRSRLGIEADGRGVHELPEALLHDRKRQNDLQELGWTILRFTWDDVVNHPAAVVAKVRKTLEHVETIAKSAF